MAQWLSQTRKMNNHYQSSGSSGGWKEETYHFDNKLYLYFNEQENMQDLYSEGIFVGMGNKVFIRVLNAPHKVNGIIEWLDTFNFNIDIDEAKTKVRDLGTATVETTWGTNEQKHMQILYEFPQQSQYVDNYKETVLSQTQLGEELDITPFKDIFNQGVQIIVDHYVGDILTDCCQVEIKTKNKSEYSVVNELFNKKFHSTDFISVK